MKLDTVLVPLDGSPVAEAVLPFLRRIAGPLDLDVVLLEVVEPLPPLDGVYVSEVPAEARFADARRYVAGCAAELARAGIRVRTIIRHGLAATEIAAAAREERVDMIAMTTHGRSGLGKLLFGSVAERVLREADVPVLMMRLGNRASRGARRDAGGGRAMRHLGLVLAVAAVLTAAAAVVPATARSVKEFSISVAETEHELYPGGPKIQAWAFNGQVPGPVMRVTEGDLVRVRFTNKHTSNHTLHFHGLNVPNEMDGVAYGHLHHLEVKPGETRTYEFVADPPGTHMYHCHVNSPQHIDMGMVGVLIVEPKDTRQEPRVDSERILLLDDWYVNDHGGHEPMAHPAMIHQANYFTVNGKAFPGIEPITLVPGERMRVRLINVGYQAHSMHLHGHSFVVTHRDGRRLVAPQEQDTLLIGPGERYDLVFQATRPGLWLFHCHVVPHVTNDGAYPGGLLIPVITKAPAAPGGAEHSATH